MATPLEQWWTVQADKNLSAQMKDDLLASLRTAAYEGIELPVGISGTAVTITSVNVSGGVVECYGTGPVSWPIRLHNPPIGWPDLEGVEIAPDGTAWRTDPIEVIADVVRNL